MTIGKRKKPKQQPLWIAHSDLAPRGGHPFYTRLNRLLDGQERVGETIGVRPHLSVKCLKRGLTPIPLQKMVELD